MSVQNKSPVITSLSASAEQEMRVKKRDGSFQEIKFDKILTRVKKIGQQANVSINFSALVMKIIDQLYDGIPTTLCCLTLRFNRKLLRLMFRFSTQIVNPRLQSTHP